MVRNIAIVVIILIVGWVLWAWLSAPKPLTGQADGADQWAEASQRQQAATAAHYFKVWEEQGADLTDLDSSDLRRCIGEHISAEQGVMATAAACAQVHLQNK